MHASKTHIVALSVKYLALRSFEQKDVRFDLKEFSYIKHFCKQTSICTHMHQIWGYFSNDYMKSHVYAFITNSTKFVFFRNSNEYCFCTNTLLPVQYNQKKLYVALCYLYKIIMTKSMLHFATCSR